MPEIAMEPVSPEHDEQHDLNSKAGYSFPIGPAIPQPDARWPALWPGLLRPGLNRHAAAATVLVRYYSKPTDDSQPANGAAKSQAAEAGWRDKKGDMKSRLDESFRNGWARMHGPAGLAAQGINVPLDIVADWLGSLKDSPVAVDFRLLVTAKLERDLRDGYHNGRNKARGSSLLFAPPFYPQIGQGPQCVVGATSWSTRYGEATRDHVRTLLHELAGEWTLLTLLFIKLLHTHMAWLAPPNLDTMVQRQRRAITLNMYYRPLIGQLRRCAMGDHPLAATAAGVLQNLGRVNLLLASDDANDPLFPRHRDALDPRHPLLPDCLHLDSALWVEQAVSEAKQILLWMDKQEGGSQWMALESNVDEVAALAWEMASARTDPFAMGGLGIANGLKTEPNFNRFTNDWHAIGQGVKAWTYQLNRQKLSDKQTRHLARMPMRSLGSIDPVPPADPAEPRAAADTNIRINASIRAIQRWAERPTQLQLYYQTLCDMLVSHGLDAFQTQPGTST